MSVFKSICADLGDNFLSTRVSFGGGFQMGCELKLAPNKQPMAFVIFYSKLLSG